MMSKIVWRIQWCILSNFYSWAKKVMSKNENVGILRKTKFFTDGILSVGVLKLARTIKNWGK